MLHLKRWTGVSAGWVLSSEIGCFGQATASDSTESNNAQKPRPEPVAAPRSRRPHACRETLCARTGRPDRKSDVEGESGGDGGGPNVQDTRRREVEEQHSR